MGVNSGETGELCLRTADEELNVSSNPNHHMGLSLKNHWVEVYEKKTMETSILRRRQRRADGH